MVPMRNQSSLPIDDSPKLNKNEIKKVPKIIGSILYYSWAVNMSVLMALSTIASERTKEMENTMEKAYQSSITWQRTRMRKYDFRRLIWSYIFFGHLVFNGAKG
jgi:hypothetical protein